jgi:hypothetical protein
MSKPRSEFRDMEKVETYSIATGEWAPDAPPMHLQVECVYKGKRVVAMYIVANGERVAYRGREGGMRAWISMRDDVAVHNGIGAPGSEALQ